MVKLDLIILKNVDYKIGIEREKSNRKNLSADTRMPCGGKQEDHLRRRSVL